MLSNPEMLQFDPKQGRLKFWNGSHWIEVRAHFIRELVRLAKHRGISRAEFEDLLPLILEHLDEGEITKHEEELS